MRMLDMFKDDATEQWSFARISAAIVVLSCIIYAGWIAWETKTLVDIPQGWLSYVLIAYGLNKASSTAKSIINNGS